MSSGEWRFSPLAEAQLDALWDYGYHRFGELQADSYLEGLFTAVAEVAQNGRYLGLAPRLVSPDEIADVTDHSVHYIHYTKHYLYLRELSDGTTGVVCILGERMDTPQRLKESLFSPALGLD